MGIKIGGQIEKVNGKELSYDEFVERYMEKNQPVVLTGLMDDWRACRDWVTDNGQPNLQFFATHFGKSKVQVADCGTREFTDQKRLEMTVAEFVEQWLGDPMQEHGNASSHSAMSKMSLYLKDWHFVKAPGLLFMLMFLGHIAGQPMCAAKNGGFSCLLLKAILCLTGMVTVSRTNNNQRDLFWNMKSCVYNIFDDVNETKISGFAETIWLECTQEQNEIIFVPSGWYHQVHNLEDTISINHNWLNAYNLRWVWDLLLRDYNEAKEYIEDIKDICDNFEGLCQRNLAANTGMNFNDFLIFLARLSLANYIQLHYLARKNGNHTWNLSPIAQHLTFNLESIQKIALNIKSVEDLTGSHGFHLDFRETLKDPEFFKLCTFLGKTYGIVHMQQNWNFATKNAWIDDMRDLDVIGTCSSQVCNPEDLIKFIELADAEFMGVQIAEDDSRLK